MGPQEPCQHPVTEAAVAWRGGGQPARAVVNPGTRARVFRDPPALDVVPPATSAAPSAGSEAARASAEGLATLAAGMREGSLAVAGGSGYFWERLGLLQDGELGWVWVGVQRASLAWDCVRRSTVSRRLIRRLPGRRTPCVPTSASVRGSSKP